MRHHNHLVSTLSFIYFVLFCILGYTSSYFGAVLYVLESTTNTNIGTISFIYCCRSCGFVLGSISSTYIIVRKQQTHKVLSVVIAISIIPLIWIIFLEDIISLFCLITIQGYTMGYFETSLTTYLIRLYSDKSSMEKALQKLHFCFGIGASLSPILIEIAILSSSKSNDFSYSFIFIAGLSIFPSILLFFIPTPQQTQSIDHANHANQAIDESELLTTPTKNNPADTNRNGTNTALQDQMIRFSPQKYLLSAHHQNSHRIQGRKYKKLISISNAINSNIEMRELSPLALTENVEEDDIDELEEYCVNQPDNTYNNQSFGQFVTHTQQLKIQKLYRTMLIISCIIISLMYGGLEVIFGGFISNYFIKEFSMSPIYGRFMTAGYYGAMCVGSIIYEKISNQLLNSNLLLIGFILSFITSGLLMLLSDNVILVIISTTFCGIFMSGLFPGTYSLIEQSKHTLNLSGNEVASIFVTGYCLGEIIVPPLVGNWMMYNGTYYFVVSIFILCNLNLFLYIFIYFCHYQFHYIMSKLYSSNKPMPMIPATPSPIQNSFH